MSQLQTMAKDSLFPLRNSACVSRPDLCSAKDTWNISLQFSISVDKFPAAQWVEHLTAPCCGPWSGFKSWRGESCRFCFFFGFLIIFLSLLIIGLWCPHLLIHIWFIIKQIAWLCPRCEIDVMHRKKFLTNIGGS